MNISTLPESSARNMRPALSCPLSRKCRMSGPISCSGACAASVTRLLARLSGDALRAIVLEPFARGDKTHERLRELGGQCLAGCGRHIVALEDRLPNGAEMAMAGDDALEREG